VFDEVQIEEWAVWPLRIPVQKPYRSAKGTLAAIPMVHTQVTTDSGVIGHSAFFVPSFALLKGVISLAAALGTELPPVRASFRDHLCNLRRKLGSWGNEGLGACAINGLEFALLDAISQRRWCALSHLLGAAPRTIRTYAGIGLDGARAAAHTAERLIDSGHRALKIKIGYPTLREDLAVVGAVKSAVGGDVKLMVDYNQALTVPEAILRSQALDKEDLVWIEEPVSASDFRGHAEVARIASTDIQAGENLWRVDQVRSAIDAGACDAFMFDPAKLGFFGWIEAAAEARRSAMTVSSHLSPHVCAQLLSGIENAGWLEWTDWWAPLVGQPIVRDGTAFSLDLPATWDQRALQTHRVQE
jgi:mandelate racemase